MDFFKIVQWETVCGGWGDVVGDWVGDECWGGGGVNSFRPIWKGNPFIKVL